MDSQTLINILIGIVGTLGSLILKAFSERITKLESSCEKTRESEKALTDKLHAVENLVAGGYVTRVEHDRTTDLLFSEIKSIHASVSSKFDAILVKLDTKLNRDDYKPNR